MAKHIDEMSRREIESELAENFRVLDIEEAKINTGRATGPEVDAAEKLARRTEELQAKMETIESIAGTARKGRELKERTMPTTQNMMAKAVRTTPGDLFVRSEAFAAYVATSKQGWSGKVDVKGFKPRVNLTGTDADNFLSRLSKKDWPGAGISLPTTEAESMIIPQRDSDLVRDTEPELLTMRDVMTVLPATSDTIRFARYSYTRAAASQEGKGGLKPYAATDVTTSTQPVETIAVLHKVSEQDIEDSPRLIGIINGEMRLDVRVEEERQLLWGTGANNEIEGLYAQGVDAYEFDRAEPGDSLIDIIRRMRTDLRKRRFSPNAVMIDPLDWEDIELAKGAATGNDHYIWGLVSSLRGPVIWSLRVVESDAMTHPTNNSRRILMGDFIRGATLYDRHDVRLAVGYVDDDFARNLRTLRAEERLALGVKRPDAFVWTETEAASYS